MLVITVKAWLVVSALLIARAASAAIPLSADLTCRSATIKVGEPLIIKVSYKWPEPLIAQWTGEIMPCIEDSTYFEVKGVDQESEASRFRVLSSTTSLQLQGTDGAEYSGHFPVLYDHKSNGLVFREPGDYLIQTQGWTVWSNPLMIEVLPPTELEEKALSLLRDQFNYAFLITGTSEYPKGREERMSEFGAIADECGDIPLGKWVAARVGIEYFKDFLEKRKGMKKIGLQSLRSEIDDPLFVKACGYLTTAYGLADEHPFREEVVSKLSSTEFMKGNYERVLSLLDELGAKYPQGQFGSRASEMKAELQKQMTLELQHSGRTDNARPGLWGRSLIIPALAVAGVAVIGVVLALVLRKRAAGKTASKTQG